MANVRKELVNNTVVISTLMDFITNREARQCTSN